MSEKDKGNKKAPTLYEWAGGLEVIQELIDKFYDKVVEDEILSPLFLHMSKQHQINVAYFISEVFGGPKLYTENGGSHFGMVKKHFQRNLKEVHRKRWMDLLLLTADELHLPDDAEFRSAFVGYLEWGTRLALVNSNTDKIEMNQDEPMPQWGWGEVGGPYDPEE